MTFTTTAGVIVIAIEIIAALAISAQAIIRMTRMSYCTRPHIVLAWMVLGCASVAVVVDVIAGKTHPSAHSAMMLLAVAALVWIDQRRSR